MGEEGEVNELCLVVNKTAYINGDFDAKELAANITNSASTDFKTQLINELFQLDPDLREEAQPVVVKIDVTALNNEIASEIEKAVKSVLKSGTRFTR